jgi:hypothetical protein
LGRGSHRSDNSLTGWRKAAFDDDVLGWQRRAVAGGDPGVLLRLCEGKEMVRCRGNEEEDGWQWRSPIEEDGREGGSKSAIPGGGFRWRGGQTTMPGCGAGGGMILFGWCRAVEGKEKEVCGGLAVEAEREKREEDVLVTPCFCKILKFAKIMHVTKIAIGIFK